MDTCFYCNRQYHPMPVWVLKDAGPISAERPLSIYVCTNWAIKKGTPEYEALDKSKIIREVTSQKGTFAFVLSGCKEKALAAGYEFRQDLTPKY